MYLNRLKFLPEKLQDEIKAISRNQFHGFNYFISDDEVLNKLDMLDFSLDFERLCSQAMLGKPIEVDGIKINPITPLIWHTLWCCGSPITNQDLKHTTVADLDIFFYLLENGFDGDYEALKKNADLYCLATFNADQFPLLSKVLMTSIRIAFFPLTFIPSNVHLEGKKKVLFDADWLASITSIVHEETGLTADEIMKKPLCFCEYYFLQFLRKNGEKHIERQHEEEK